MLRKFEALDPVEVIGDAIQATAAEAKNLNREQLFLRGEKADGTRLKDYKSDKYARRKYAMNPAPGFGVPDAYLTGELQRELFIDVRSDTVVFDSTSPHAAFMIERDGPAVFGLTDDSKEKYRETFMPVALRDIKAKTGVK